MTALMYIILGSATGIKIFLFIYCYALKTQSGGVLQSRACFGSMKTPFDLCIRTCQTIFCQQWLCFPSAAS